MHTISTHSPVTLSKMSHDEYTGKQLTLHISYNFYTCKIGNLLIASSQHKIMYIGFVKTKKEASSDLRNRFPNAKFTQNVDKVHNQVLLFLENPYSKISSPLLLHTYGTDFQFSVWQSLLNIPLGRTSSYAQIAMHIQAPRAVRAVGTAIGKNPIAVLIPCHRVTKSDGTIGSYHWGTDVKVKLLSREKTISTNGY